MGDGGTATTSTAGVAGMVDAWEHVVVVIVDVEAAVAFSVDGEGAFGVDIGVGGPVAGGGGHHAVGLSVVGVWGLALVSGDVDV